MSLHYLKHVSPLCCLLKNINIKIVILIVFEKTPIKTYPAAWSLDFGQSFYLVVKAQASR